MPADVLNEKVTALLKTAGYHEPVELVPLGRGGNNRLFLARVKGRIIGIIKQYYPTKHNLRDRLSSEYRFSEFLWHHNIHRIPMPIACDPSNHLAFFGYIDGRRISPEEITEDHINQALDFFHAINTWRTSEDARELPDAAEACFSLGEHIGLTGKRVLSLERMGISSSLDKKAQGFVRDELRPAWDAVRKKALFLAKDSGIGPDQPVPGRDRRLSPSDFGFHNALVNERGRLFFLDFEYAGWDDPAKTVCDFFCQPEIPVPEQFFPLVTESILAGMEDVALHRRRIGILRPVYQVKWCCIVMNEFLPRGKSRRAFMEKPSGSESVKEEQLRKAGNILQNISLDS